MPDTKQGSAAAAPAAATPEPLAAIFAEMRLDADILVFPTLTPDKLRTYADRIERAAERERNAHTNDIHDALYMATGIPGNAAAMREALEQALAYCESDQKSGLAYSDNDVLVPMLRAALAAPARNCDVGTADDLRREARAAIGEEKP